MQRIRFPVSRPIVLLTLLLAVSIAPLSAVPATATDNGRFFVYLEVPGDFADPTEATVVGLTMLGTSGAADLPLARRALAAADVAGRQILLATGEAASGHYDTLMIQLGSVHTQAGVADVAPEIRSRGYPVAVDTDLARGGVRVVRLLWRPGPAPVDGRTYAPDIEARHEPVPPLGSLALVTERDSGCMIIVDRLAGRVVDALVVGEDPRAVVYARSRQKFYVALAGEDGIGVVDGLSLRLERTVPLQFGDDPDRLALSPDEAMLYVLNEGSRTLAAMATWSMQETGRAPVGEQPRALAIDPQTGYVYVACEGSGEVQVFNPSGLVMLSTMVLTAKPVEVVFGEDTRQLFVASGSERRLFGFDLESGREIGGRSLCGMASGMAYDPRSRQLFVAVPSCGEIAVMRPAAGLEFAPLALPGPPGRLAFAADRRQLLVLLPGSAELAICSPQRGTVTAVVPLGGRPHTVVAP